MVPGYRNGFTGRVHDVGKFVHVYKIAFQKGNHIGKNFQSKVLKSNHGVRISRKAGVVICAVSDPAIF